MRAKRAVLSRRRLALMTATLLIARCAYAQDQGGPIVVNPRPALTPVHFDTPTGSLNGDYFYEYDTDKQPATPSTNSKVNSFQETVSALTQGYVFNPNFIQFSASGLFGLEQDTNSGTNGSQSGNSIVDGWNVSATGLASSSAPVTVFTRRDQDYVNPAFSPTLKDTNTAYGAGTRIQDTFAPTQISFTHTDDEQTQPSGGLTQYELHQDNATWHTDFVTLPNQTLTFDYAFQNTDTSENQSQDEKYQTNVANLSHTVNFGQRLQDSLTSSFSLTDQSGFLAYQETHVDELLRIQNSPSLQTHYQYTFDNTEVNGVDQTSNKVDAGFVKHVYQSLVMSGDAGGEVFDDDGSDIDDVFGHLDFAYHKKAPGGLLLSYLNLGWQYQFNQESGNPISIFNQPNTFVNDQPIILSQQNVDPNSIVVTNGSIIYKKGVDYAIAQLGNLTEIERLPGGLIPFAGSVLLDYDLLPEPSNTTNTENLSTGLRYQFDQGVLAGLAPYIHYSVQAQSIDAGDNTNLIPETFNDITTGADYQIGKFSFNGEGEWHVSSLVPYNSNRCSARYVDSTGLDTTFSLNGTFQNTDYYEEGDIANDLAISAAFTKRLNTQASITASVIYLNDRDELFGNSQGLEQQLELDLQIRQFQLFARGRNAFLNSDTDRSTVQSVEIGIKRSF